MLKAELKRLEWETKRNEFLHLLGLLLITCVLIVKSPQLSVTQVLLIFFINLYVKILVHLGASGRLLDVLPEVLNVEADCP